MKKNKDQKTVFFLLFIVLLCCCLSFTACSKKNDRRGDRKVELTDFNTIEKEYLDYLGKLNWPEGYSISTKLEGEVAEQFQVGYGETRASMLWEYAWEKEWLKFYRTDSVKAEEAIKELEKASGMLYMSPAKCDDATRRYFRDNLEKAKLGDPSGFEENIRLNTPE